MMILLFIELIVELRNKRRKLLSPFQFFPKNLEIGLIGFRKIKSYYIKIHYNSPLNDLRD